jgi:hypothetical protein
MEYDKNRNPIHNNPTLLASKSTDELAKSKEWKDFVKDCYKEHGYGWYYKGSDTNYKKTNFRRKKRRIKNGKNE